jgi:hypothetical protein
MVINVWHSCFRINIEANVHGEGSIEAIKPDCKSKSEIHTTEEDSVDQQVALAG